MVVMLQISVEYLPFFLSWKAITTVIRTAVRINAPQIAPSSPPTSIPTFVLPPPD